MVASLRRFTVCCSGSMLFLVLPTESSVYKKNLKFVEYKGSCVTITYGKGDMFILISFSYNLSV
jgi:hypothetical protein